jgi:hypothetical protein
MPSMPHLYVNKKEKLCPAIHENFRWQESITLLVNRSSDELLCAAHVALVQL